MWVCPSSEKLNLVVYIECNGFGRILRLTQSYVVDVHSSYHIRNIVYFTVTSFMFLVVFLSTLKKSGVEASRTK